MTPDRYNEPRPPAAEPARPEDGYVGWLWRFVGWAAAIVVAAALLGLLASC